MPSLTPYLTPMILWRCFTQYEPIQKLSGWRRLITSDKLGTSGGNIPLSQVSLINSWCAAIIKEIDMYICFVSFLNTEIRGLLKIINQENKNKTQGSWMILEVSTLWGKDKVAEILQTTFSNSFSCVEIAVSFIKISLRFFPKGSINKPALVWMMVVGISVCNRDPSSRAILSQIC